MRQSEIDSLVESLNGSGSDREWEAVCQLRTLPDLPDYLLSLYSRSTKAGTRAACVYHCTRYAKVNQSAFRLGMSALADRSKTVRYRAALLLAVAQRIEAIPALRAMSARYEGTESARDAEAAIAAIESHEPNRFVDREGSGLVTLRVE